MEKLDFGTKAYYGESVWNFIRERGPGQVQIPAKQARIEEVKKILQEMGYNVRVREQKSLHLIPKSKDKPLTQTHYFTEPGYFTLEFNGQIRPYARKAYFFPTFGFFFGRHGDPKINLKVAKRLGYDIVKIDLPKGKRPHMDGTPKRTFWDHDFIREHRIAPVDIKEKEVLQALRELGYEASIKERRQIMEFSKTKEERLQMLDLSDYFVFEKKGLTIEWRAGINLRQNRVVYCPIPAHIIWFSPEASSLTEKLFGVQRITVDFPEPLVKLPPGGWTYATVDCAYKEWDRDIRREPAKGSVFLFESEAKSLLEKFLKEVQPLVEKWRIKKA